MTDFMDRVLALMDERDVNATTVCKGIGVKDASFSAWKAKSARVTITNRQKLAKFLNTTVEYLETGIHPKYCEMAPLIQSKEDMEILAVTLQDGLFNPALKGIATSSILERDESAKRFSDLPASWCMNRDKKPGLFAWTLANDSMDNHSKPSYPKNAQILFDPEKEPRQGKCILVMMDNKLDFRLWTEINGTHILTLLNTAMNQGTAINYTGSIWDIWVGTPIAYTVVDAGD